MLMAFGVRRSVLSDAMLNLPAGDSNIAMPTLQRAFAYIDRSGCPARRNQFPRFAGVFPRIKPRSLNLRALAIAVALQS
jgi:hypothetical protein